MDYLINLSINNYFFRAFILILLYAVSYYITGMFLTHNKKDDDYYLFKLFISFFVTMILGIITMILLVLFGYLKH